MDFLKKHYEKVVLGIVLLLLVAATASLPFIKAAQEKQMQDIIDSSVRQPKIAPLTNLDLTAESNTIAREAQPFVVDFGSPNKLFNPLQWVKTLDGRLKVNNETNIGPLAVTIAKTTPLYLIISLDQVLVSDSGTRYGFGVTKQAAQRLDQRNKHQSYLAIGGKNDTFTLLAVHGPVENPTNLVIQLNDADEPVKMNGTNGPPYKRIDGYMADLKYEPEKREWKERRVDMVISLNGEDYKIVSISENEVVLSSARNQKKTTIKFNPANSNTAISNNSPPNNPP